MCCSGGTNIGNGCFVAGIGWTPQQEDFKEEMIKRLSLPKGFTIEVAASGLGKPRMITTLNKSSLYVTRRDQGDVLLLTDINNDGILLEDGPGTWICTGLGGYFLLWPIRVIKATPYATTEQTALAKNVFERIRYCTGMKSILGDASSI